MKSLFSAEEREAKLDKKGDTLVQLNKHIDFAGLAAVVDREAPRPSRDKGGRPPFPTELMVRVLGSNCSTSATNNWSTSCWTG